MSARRTRIVATLGPATRSPEAILALVNAGVDVCRINGSHASGDMIRELVARVRRAAMQRNRPVGILLDLQGPKIRTGDVLEPLPLEGGDLLTVRMDEDFVAPPQPRPAHGEGHFVVGTTWTGMAKDVSVGDPVLFADGALRGVVSAVRRHAEPAEVDIQIELGGQLGSHKGINLPGTVVSAPCLTEKDIEDLEAGVRAGVDFVALSFVREAADVIQLKDHLRRLDAPDMPVIAKIEKPQAVANIDEIVRMVDGIMVARGDLGVEVSLEKVPILQKELIAAANRAGVLVITATQMLDSMERNPSPTRAETTDVANAILDGTDAVMLSGETAVGRWPLLAVETMDRIGREVEGSRWMRSVLEEISVLAGPSQTVVRSACFAVREVPRPLVVFTWSGATAQIAAKSRPPGPIFALTPNQTTYDRLSLVWGVTPVLAPTVDSTDELIALGENTLLERGLLRRGEEVVALAGNTPMKGATNTMKVFTVGMS